MVGRNHMKRMVLCYPIKRPEEDSEMFQRFEELLDDMRSFSPFGFSQTNITKCRNCIYEPLCSYSATKG